MLMEIRNMVSLRLNCYLSGHGNGEQSVRASDSFHTVSRKHCCGKDVVKTLVA